MRNLSNLPAAGETSSIPARFKISMEKSIEALWHASNRQGVTFRDFTAEILAILIVLRHRGRL